MTKISVVVPFYNCPYVDQAIESIVNQTYSNIEIIVVNDGSTKHVDKLTNYFSKIRYIEKENGGTASALNEGIKAATGDYFCWLSSDDIFLPEKTERQVAFMRENNAAFCHTNFVLINEHSDVTSAPVGYPINDRLETIRFMRKNNLVNGCTVMMAMEIFKDVGLFNEDLKYTQDYDLWLRIIQKYHLYYLNEALVQYRYHTNMGSIKYASNAKRELRTVISRHRHKMQNLFNYYSRLN